MVPRSRTTSALEERRALASAGLVSHDHDSAVVVGRPIGSIARRTGSTIGKHDDGIATRRMATAAFCAWWRPSLPVLRGLWPGRHHAGVVAEQIQVERHTGWTGGLFLR